MAPSGVLASIRDAGAGKVRLVFEDVSLGGGKRRGSVFYTHRDFSSRSFRLADLRARDLQDIGFAVIARLAAHDAVRRAPHTGAMFTGAWVRFRTVPPWVSAMPLVSRRVFRFCRGRAYQVSEVTHDGLLVLDVSADVDARFGGYANDLRIEPEYVQRVAVPSGRRLPRRRRE